MKLKRFKNFINEEFLFNRDILPIDLVKGNYYTVFNKKKNKWIKGLIFNPSSSGVVKVKAMVHLFEIDNFGEEDVDDRLRVLPEHVNTNIIEDNDGEPVIFVEPEQLKKGETYYWKNEFSGEFEDWCQYIGLGEEEIEVPNYWFSPRLDSDDMKDTVFAVNNTVSVPYTELKDRVKEDLVVQNKARKKYNLY